MKVESDDEFDKRYIDKPIKNYGVFLPGEFISLLTFPGVIVHEIAHHIACNITGVKVVRAKYFRFMKNPSGYVLHEPPENFNQTFLICVAPFILNTLLALISFLILFMFVNPKSTIFSLGDNPIDYIPIWFGLSFGMNAFPSSDDMSILWKWCIKHWRSNPISLVGLPFAVVFYISNLLEFFWFDTIYSVYLCVFVWRLLGRV